MNDKLFSDNLLEWYNKMGRDLPWRRTKNPYKIWLSEVILQQTRVAQGLPYYKKFIEKYPNVHELAHASEQEVLRLWQGLGYYSRARNLHTCAKHIVEHYEGAFPGTYQELLRLKGVGTYTAAAIASFSFNEVVPVVDGNVMRVLSRIFGMYDDISSSPTKKVFFRKAQYLIDPNHPAEFNQAIMDFGAMQCTPKKPDCLFCPFREHCYAFLHQMQNELPVKSKKTNQRKRFLQYFVIEYDNQLLMKKRDNKGIWAGLYEFYLLESDHQPDSPDKLEDPRAQYALNNTVIEEISVLFQHQLSHQLLNVTFYKLKTTNYKLIQQYEREGYYLYSMNKVEELPKPTLIVRYLESAFN